MTDLPPRSRRVRPAPVEPPVGAVTENPAPQTGGTKPKVKATYDIPHDLEWTQTKTTRMTREHEDILNELKFRHGLKIQEAIWYAVENTFNKK